jgi:16S rRNA (cytidine1402-2'-O)-methyltransferase
LPLDSFYFAGFLTSRSGPRQRRLEELREISATLIFYESPRRLDATLAVLEEVLGDRPACVARELTKIHEEFLRFSLSQLRALGAERSWRGEITLLVAGCDRASHNDSETVAAVENQIRARLADPDFSKDRSNRDLVDLLQAEFPRLKRRQVYDLVLKKRKKEKRGQATLL